MNFIESSKRAKEWLFSDAVIDILSEAFKAGSSKIVAEKTASILSKRLGTKFNFSPIPFTYTSSNGSFVGYEAGFNSKEKIRVNFNLSGKSEVVDSLDYWTDDALDTPKYHIDLNGHNIVQVIDSIQDVITGEYFIYAKELKERKMTKKQALESFFDEHGDILKDLDKRGRVNYGTFFKNFSNYCINEISVVPPKTLGSFRFLVSTTLKDMRMVKTADNVPIPKVSNGIKEEPISTSAEDKEGAIFEKQILENEHIIKFEMLEDWMNEVKAGNPEYLGLYIYGQGGIGKSYLADKILKPLPNCYYMAGKISGYTGLLQLLFDHKDNEIIVLDDVLTANDMKNTTIENILKGVLDPDTPRKVTIAKKRKEGDEVVKSDEEDMYNFIFNSTIVFITNYEDVPQALDDRCWILRMIFTNDQIADIIGRALNAILPEVDMGIKQKVLAIAKKYSRKALSFRRYKRALNTYLTSGGNIQKFIIVLNG